MPFAIGAIFAVLFTVFVTGPCIDKQNAVMKADRQRCAPKCKPYRYAGTDNRGNCVCDMSTKTLEASQ